MKYLVMVIAALLSTACFASNESDLGIVKAVRRTYDFQIDDLVNTCTLDPNKLVSCVLDLFPLNGTELLVSLSQKYASVQLPGTHDLVEFAFNVRGVTAIFSSPVANLEAGKQRILDGYQLSTLPSKSPTSVVYLVK